MWIKQCRLLILQFSFYRKRAKNIYIIKKHFHLQSRVKALSKTPRNHGSCLHYDINILQIQIHICTLLFLTREFARKKYSVSEQEKKTPAF